MAKQFTGIDGAFYTNGARIGKITNWTFQGSAEALETTTLGDFARTFCYGVQSYNGSCTLLYYESSGNQIEGGSLMTDVFNTNQVPTDRYHEIELRYLNGAGFHSVRFHCLIPTVSISATVGGIVTAEINFQVTGSLKAATIG